MIRWFKQWQANRRLEADRAMRLRLIGTDYAKRHAAGKKGWQTRRAG